MTADFVESKPLHKPPYKSGRDILDLQFRGGRGVIDRNDWARRAYDDLRRRCAHIPEEDLVRLFHARSQSQLELIQGDAVFREYNATHLPGRRRRVRHAKPKAPSKVALVSKPAADARGKTRERRGKAPPARKASKPKAKPARSKGAGRKAAKSKPRRR